MVSMEEQKMKFQSLQWWILAAVDFFLCRPLRPVSPGGRNGTFQRSAIGGQKRVVLSDCQ
jgi:hypothetical protein